MKFMYFIFSTVVFLSLQMISAEETDKNENFGLEISVKKAPVNDFAFHASEQSGLFKQKAAREKVLSGILLTLGISAVGTGLGLVVHQYGFNKDDSSAAQFPLLLGGLSLAGAGVAANYFSNYNNRKSLAFYDLSHMNYGNNINPADVYDSSYSGTVKVQSVADLKSHGTGLLFISLASLSVNIFLYYKLISPFTGSGKSNDSKDDDSSSQVAGLMDDYIDGFGIFIGFLVGTIALAPTIVIFTSGLMMHIYANKWAKLGKYEQPISLNSITPVIDPVSKTYGFNLGFSF